MTMQNTDTTTGRHTRTITGADGVSDETAIAWSDQEELRRLHREAFIVGAHRAYT